MRSRVPDRSLKAGERSHRMVKTISLFLAVVVVAGCLLPAPVAAQGITSTWTGAFSVSATAEYQTLNWSDSGNWSAGVPGSTAGITNADTAVFTGPDTASFLTVLTPANLNIANITFDATANLSNDWGWRIGQSSGPAILLTDGGTIQTTAAVACNTNQIMRPARSHGHVLHLHFQRSRSVRARYRWRSLGDDRVHDANAQRYYWLGRQYL